MSNDQNDENDKHIFQLGIWFLLGWMLVIILCASPQLFRNLLQRYLFCWCCPDEKKEKEKAIQSQKRLRDFLGDPLAAKPSSILLQQVMGVQAISAIKEVRIQIETIPEEQRAGSEACSLSLNMEKSDVV